MMTGYLSYCSWSMSTIEWVSGNFVERLGIDSGNTGGNAEE